MASNADTQSQVGVCTARGLPWNDAHGSQAIKELIIPVHKSTSNHPQMLGQWQASVSKHLWVATESLPRPIPHAVLGHDSTFDHVETREQDLCPWLVGIHFFLGWTVGNGPDTASLVVPELFPLVQQLSLDID